MPRKSKFLDSWLKNPLYSAWIVPGKVHTLARCKCCKDVNISNMGINEGINALFCEMFSDSKIAHSFSLSRTKRKSYSSEGVHYLRGVFL